jgi:ribosome-binding factor A
MEGLDRAKGFIRTELGKRIRLRHTPEIQFRIDDSLEEGAKVISLINEMQKEGRDERL